MSSPSHSESAEQVEITVNGRAILVREGSSVAAAMMAADTPCRLSISGEPRGPLCGMGICMECRATVDGVAHVRTCQSTVRAGMQVMTA